MNNSHKQKYDSYKQNRANWIQYKNKSVIPENEMCFIHGG